jgi:hypothetical protein
MDPDFNRASVQTFLESEIPGDIFDPEGDFLRINRIFEDRPGKVAVFIRDIPHRAHPDLFADPARPDAPPLEWRFATEEGNWLHNAQQGGLPLMFKTQDGNPRWIQILDPTTQNPVILYNYHRLQQEVEEERPRFGGRGITLRTTGPGPLP